MTPQASASFLLDATTKYALATILFVFPNISDQKLFWIERMLAEERPLDPSLPVPVLTTIAKPIVKPAVSEEHPLPATNGKGPLLYILPDGKKVPFLDGVAILLGSERLTTREISERAKDLGWRFSSCAITPTLVMYITLSKSSRFKHGRHGRRGVTFENIGTPKPLVQSTPVPTRVSVSAPIITVTPPVDTKSVWQILRTHFRMKTFVLAEVAQVVGCAPGRLSGAFTSLRNKGLVQQTETGGRFMWSLTTVGRRSTRLA